MKTSSSQRQGLPVIHERAAGIDIGSRFHVVAVPVDLAEESVQTFKAFTADLERMADWLVKLGITTVAMESTGVYWIPVYEILESHGLHVVLANARDARAVPGRKTDVNDAQWIQRLHACGLLRASFHPDREIAALRSYLRLRERHLDYAAAHIQHMQKALTHMNLQLHHVVADITGATGMRIIRAIVAGERNAAKLATLRDTRCKSSVETIQSALVGNYQPEHVFALAQALAMYDAYQAQLEVCDQQIAQSLQRLSRQRPSPRATAERAQLRCPCFALSVGRRRPDPDPRHRPLPGTAANRRVRHRSKPLAYRPALHVLADPGSWLPDQRWKSALGAHAQDQESGNSPSPVSRRNHWQNEHGVGRFLSTLVGAYRQGQGRDRHCAQDRHPVLQRDALRHGLSGSRCRSL